jgi:hypothetical protein
MCFKDSQELRINGTYQFFNTIVMILFSGSPNLQLKPTPCRYTERDGEEQSEQDANSGIRLPYKLERV